jgi:hypothetical protein
MPLSKKADVALSVLKWGIITIPIVYVIATLAPLLKGTAAALGGAGAALKGAGAAAQEGAASVKAARTRLTRPNPDGMTPEEFRRRHVRIGQLSLLHEVEGRRQEAPYNFRYLASGEALKKLWGSPMTRNQTRMADRRQFLTRNLNAWIDNVRRAEARGELNTVEYARAYVHAYADGISYLEEINAPEPTVRLEP